MVVGALSLTAGLDARAERLSPALIVTRAPGADDCPDAAGIVTQVRTMTSSDPFAAPPDGHRDTWLEVEFTRTLAGYRAGITARGRRQGTRSIDDVGPGCASLSDAVAITLVMLLDPEVAGTNPGAVGSDVLPSPPSEPARKPATRVTFGAEAMAGAMLGVLAHGGPFVEAGGRAGFGRTFALALGGGFVFPDRTSTPPGSVTLDLWYGYARFSGALLERGGTRLALFLGPSIGSLGGSSHGFEYSPDQRILWIAGAFGLEVFAALSRSVSWSARLFALAPLRHEGFYVIDAGAPHDAFRTPDIGGALSLGVSGTL